MTNSSYNKVNIKLGDIIEIDAPNDDLINSKIFLVDYVGNTKITLINLTDEQADDTILYVEDGNLRNESIETIIIQKRNDISGYARQNDLLPNTWIDIQFDGNIPLIITGRITNLEEDQIEIKTVQNDTIYIDFAYQGLPIELDIKEINIREPPENIINETSEDLKNDDEVDSIDVDVGEDDIDDEISNDEFQSNISNLIMDADQIKFGSELEEITETVYLPESEQRFGIEKQLSDLLDEMLSTLPNSKRTYGVLNNIHRMITRYKELRNEFSIFDEYNNVTEARKNGANYKPLVNTLANLNHKLYWLLIVCKNKKKIYNVETVNEDENIDVTLLNTQQTLAEQNDIYDKFLENDSSENEKKYIHLERKLSDYSKPYSNPTYTHDVIITKPVKSNLLAVVNNLEDFKSSAIDKQMLTQKRFLLQTYLTGKTMLETTKKNATTSVKKISIVPDEDISIKSILTLPEPTVRFSRINLPGTDIITRSNLNNNFLNYWLLLKEKTIVSTVITDEKQLYLDENNYLKQTTEYLPDLSKEDSKDYEKYLDSIVPKTRILFNLIKKYITNNLSIYEVLKYMEPFMVYQQDISFKQYEEFIGFIGDKINLVKTDFVKNNRLLNNLNVKSSKYNVSILDILNKNDTNIYNEVIEAYNIRPDTLLQSGEIYNKIIKLDNGRLYNIALCLSIVSLMIPDGVSKLHELYNLEGTKEKEKNSDCNKNILAKKYIELDELEEDNGKEIYFDKKYDTTYYEIINEYKNELDELQNSTTEQQIEFLSNKLQTTNGFNKVNSYREARALIEKQRLVENGEYAVLEQQTETGPKIYYYRRTDNVWFPDENIDVGQFTDNSKVFCNLNTNCINIDTKCEDISDGKTLIESNNIKNLLDEFDVNFQKDIQEIKKNIQEEYAKSIINIKIISNLNDKKRLISNNYQYDIGLTLDESEKITSPYEELRDKILGQSDFVKKQKDIINFVNYYSRPSNDNEDEWWLYCNETNIKLLPSFIYKLAKAYVDNNNYLNVLNEICATQGEKSDDDSYIVDKYSGYNIKAIDFDVSEGYTEEGYKIKSRDLLEAEFNYTLVQNSNSKRVFESPETEKIYKVSNAIAKFSGINLDSHIDFITRNVVITREKTMISKENHERAQSKNKKIISYEKALNSQLIILTLSYFIVSIQSSIPPVKTRKRYPGCVKSFTGYPMGGEDDLSGITYIACIANKIKSSVEPWDSIKKMKIEDIVKKINMSIQKYIINTPEVKDKINDRILYNRSNVDSEIIPEELDIKKWNSFLPQLQSVKIKSFEQVSKAFMDELKSNYKNGSKQQHEKINVLRGKIIYSTLKIQELIQNIISKKKAILTNSSAEPFLENSCCDSNITKTLQYFTDINGEIVRLNNDVVNTQNLLDDLETLKKANTIFIPTNTKLKYPEISSDYSEETIYKVFIYYCKFNNNVPVNEELRAICNDKPLMFDNNIDIKEQIQNLKSQGYNYNNKSLNQLLDVINKKGMKTINVQNIIYNNVNSIKSILDYSYDNNIVLPSIFIDKFIALIDNYQDGELMKDTKEMEQMKNYLNVANENMKLEITNFIKQNLSKKPNKKIIECIETISKFSLNSDISDPNYESTYKMINYIKLTIRSLCKLYPNIIINNVDYKNVYPPKHWNLSQNHKNDFNKIINKYYEPISSYKSEKDIKLFLEELVETLNIIYELSENTLFHTPVVKNNNTFYSVFDNKMCLLLFQYYFYLIVKEHITILNNTDLLKKASLISNEGSAEIIYNEDDDLQIEAEIISGERSSLSEKVASLLNSYATMICSHKKDINYNYSEITELVHRAKEKEKDTITTYLKNLSESEREIENYFKKHKLEKWSKGLQKGLRIYQGDTYDEERKQLHDQAINDIKIGKNDKVTDMVRDIYNMDLINQDQEEELIENEELSLNLLPNDDDYGDHDGDEYF